MQLCEKCLENNWKTELPDVFTVIATCQHCGHEVQWITRRGRKHAGLPGKRKRTGSKT